MSIQARWIVRVANPTGGGGHGPHEMFGLPGPPAPWDRSCGAGSHRNVACSGPAARGSGHLLASLPRPRLGISAVHQAVSGAVAGLVGPLLA